MSWGKIELGGSIEALPRMADIGEKVVQIIKALEAQGESAQGIGAFIRTSGDPTRYTVCMTPNLFQFAELFPDAVAALDEDSGDLSDLNSLKASDETGFYLLVGDAWTTRWFNVGPAGSARWFRHYFSRVAAAVSSIWSKP